MPPSRPRIPRMPRDEEDIDPELAALREAHKADPEDRDKRLALALYYARHKQDSRFVIETIDDINPDQPTEAERTLLDAAETWAAATVDVLQRTTDRDLRRVRAKAKEAADLGRYNASLQLDVGVVLLNALRNRSTKKKRGLFGLLERSSPPHQTIRSVEKHAEEAFDRTLQLAEPGTFEQTSAAGHLLKMRFQSGRFAEVVPLLGLINDEAYDALAGDVAEVARARAYQRMNVAQRAETRRWLEGLPPSFERELLLAELERMVGAPAEAVSRCYALLDEPSAPLLHGDTLADLLPHIDEPLGDCPRCESPLGDSTLTCLRCEFHHDEAITMQAYGDGTLNDEAIWLVLANALAAQGLYADALAVLEELPQREAIRVWVNQLHFARERANYHHELDVALDQLHTGSTADALRRLRGLQFNMHNDGMVEAWLIVAAVREGALEEIDYERVLALASWGAIPLQERAQVAEALLSAAHPETLTLLHALYTPDFPPRIEEAYRQAEARAQATLIQRIEESLRHKQLDRALDAAALLDRIGEQTAAVRIAQARVDFARGRATEAGEAFRQVAYNDAYSLAERTAAYVALAEAQEAIGDLQGARRTLDDAPNETEDVLLTRERLTCRINGQPALLLRPLESDMDLTTLERIEADAGRHQAVFGVRIAAAAGWREGTAGLSRADMLMGAYSFVAAFGALADKGEPPTLQVRLEGSGRGDVRVLILVGVRAATRERAETRAREIWARISPHVPLLDQSIYDYQPVFSRKALRAALEPFPLSYMAEIVRRTDIRDEAYAIHPFGGAHATLNTLMATLKRSDVPAMFVAQIQPTHLHPWERDAIERRIEALNEVEAETDIDPMEGPTFTFSMGDERQRQLRALLMQFQEVLDRQAFILRMMIASTEENTVLPQALATHLFGPAGSYEVQNTFTEAEAEVVRRNLTHLEAVIARPRPGSADMARLPYLAGTSEAAAVARLPLPNHEGIIGVPRMGVRAIPPTLVSQRGTVLGESVATELGRPQPVHLEMADRRRHVYAVGKTGVGKSTLLENMALQDITEGKGVAILDPHGDLIEAVLARIPPKRAGDVVIFDPSDEARPVGLNYIAAEGVTDQNRVATEFTQLLVRLYDPGTMGIAGPIFQQEVSMATLTALQTIEDATLLDVVRILSDYKYARDELVPKVTDPVLKTYWEKQQKNTSDHHRSERLSYVISKFNRFTGDLRVRHIIGQGQSTIDFRQIMDERQILLVNLSKGHIGQESASFLGMLVMQSLLNAVLSRAKTDKSARTDFCLYVDEFQSFATDTFEAMLSEGRKYGLCLTMANQYTSQLPPRLREAVFGNVGSLIAFNVGIRDAEIIASEFYPTFSRDDLVNLPRFTAVARLLVKGMAARPFAMRTRPSQTIPDAMRAEHIRQAARQRYGTDVEKVRREVAKKM